MRPITIAFAALALGATAPAFAQAAPDAAMQGALAQDNRADDRARDEWRHPAETLEFFEVEPGMTVVDYMPASGWYTRVLVPYLGSAGRYVGIMPDPASADVEGMAGYFAKLPAAFAKDSPGWNLAGAPVAAYASQDVPEALKGTVDRALIFREMHNLYRSGALRAELMRLRELLKDDGMLGIVQHRAKPWAAGDYTDGSRGYMRQSDVIGLVEAAGFELVGTSEVNANAKDSADHPKGVWELPPSRSTNRAELDAIGESDRMTLLFRKR
ncbi:hypothetical protein MKP08_00685 [Erythrobacter sp. LQ02-29]|uniref:class I SAM-dependent methyltransferase n=1 Tax=Erythrobacter sp. LQ02-29 TaxID=2920384 RepID=UPI001F4E0530|nr:hypothetical protein [Erythrobacter sp. LQ02-29]MCP9221265.1 hypothetical protein [Erythrobacter sp. LQ02-29]